jgi:argininosuccinate synthase
VSGKVFITPTLPVYSDWYRVIDLMSSKFGSYGEMNKGWSGDDVKGFANIWKPVGHFS